ncbi:MAG TPA: SxtJ family membrane protein [Pirellulales bacterium]|nr:SxtJ family membrane protein [Pirellulales bacterium]
MRFSDIDFHPSDRTLRQFAGLSIVFFAAMACWQGWAHGRTTLAAVLAVAAVVVGPLGLMRPQAVRPIFVGWMLLVLPIGWLVSHAILAFLFFGLFTPIAWVFKLMGRDALALRRRTADSYWQPKLAVSDRRRYFRQY